MLTLKRKKRCSVTGAKSYICKALILTPQKYGQVIFWINKSVNYYARLEMWAKGENAIQNRNEGYAAFRQDLHSVLQSLGLPEC